MGKTLEVRSASAADLDALVSLATAFRDHVGLSAPSEVDLRTSIAQLLQDRETEFFVACSADGTSLGYVQSRYRYSAWTTGLETEIEDVFVVQAARRRGVGRQLVAFACGVKILERIIFTRFAVHLEFRPLITDTDTQVEISGLR